MGKKVASDKTKTEYDKMKGMLWGLVVGDCMGSPIQFTPKDEHPWITEMVPCPVFGLPKGYWTDDTSMALCIMASYIRKNGKYDLKDIGDRFMRWYLDGYLSSTPGESFDVGRATRRACEAILAGSYRNGEEESQGNGSIMRFAPSFLLARREAKPAKVMHEISDLTHRSRKVRLTIDKFARTLEALMAGDASKVKSKYATREEADNSGWAVSTLESALWAFKSTGSFEEGMVAAINLGGDADSIGAVYGQVAGAYYGYSAIPRRWVESVKTWQQLDAVIDRFLALVVR